MSQTAKALREKRAKVIADGRAILDKAEAENREPTAEERQKYAELMGDIRRDASGQPVPGPDGKPERVRGEEEKLKAQIDVLERQERLEAEMNAPPPADRDRLGRDHVERERADDGRGCPGAPTDGQRALALQAWCLTQVGREITDDHRDACRATGVNPQSREFVASLRTDHYRRVRAECLAQMRAEDRAGASAPQSSLVGSSGGYTVPEGFVNNLEIALLQYGGIRQAADVMRTATGQDLPWPTVNDTSVKGYRIAENANVTTKDIGFGTVVFHAYRYTSGVVLVPVDLLQDSAFQLGSTIGELCGIRIGRIQADEFTTGTGAAMPTGVMQAATLGVTAAVATGLAADDLYTLKHSVDPAYRINGAGWMMHDQILLAAKKLKDGMGRYLWQASLAGGAPDTIDGDRIVINQSMDSTLASGKKVALYGLLSKYKIRDVAEVRLRRLVERYADADQEGFIMFVRGDGNLIDAGTHPVKYLQN